MGERVGWIGKLIDEKCPRRAPRDRLGEVLVIIGMPLAYVRTGDDDLSPHRPGVQHFFPRHLVRHHEQRAIAFASADQRKAETGIAGGRFDNGAAKPQASVGLSRLDHAARGPVLQRA